MIPTQKSSKLFVCECCNYSSCRKSQYQRHLSTTKHKILQNPTYNPISKKFQLEKLYTCQCGKTYKHSSTLYAHKKNCTYKNDNIVEEQYETKQETTKNEINFDKELIMMLIKQNAELMEIVKNGSHNTTNNTTTNHTNSHNKAFNLNFFLNETCKNAMNITDFVDSIKLQLTDLMEVGELGYVEGISKIIVKNLNNLDETVRPIHCTDKKRETMYVKDHGEWSKEDDNKTKLKKAINKVADKNIRLLPQFREKYPEYRNAYSKISDVHDKIVIEVMETEDDKKEKIIKNISKATTIKDNNQS
jgi:hypothetical protein